MPLQYSEFVRFVFDRTPTPNGWYFDEDVGSVEASDPDLVDWVTKLLAGAESELMVYSDAQIDQGLWFLFHNSCSDLVYSLKSNLVSESARIELIRAFGGLYRDVFEKRCEPVLGHLSQRGSPLNNSCYMLWDVSPLSYWEDDPSKDLFYVALAEMLEQQLQCSNVACLESALHGLGHLHPYIPSVVESSIGRFLAGPRAPEGALARYAEAARQGCIQ